MLRSSSRRHASSCAVAFDIDGVLLRGKSVLPKAHETLVGLKERGIPHVFLTNGGGVLEHEKAEQLSNLLRTEVRTEQVILAHTPMRSLAKKYADKRVLIMGTFNVADVARSYGFKNTVSVRELARAQPQLYPLGSHWFTAEDAVEPEPIPACGETEPVEAIMIMHDPVEWSFELQIACDVLRGGTPLGSGRGAAQEQVPLYVSNQDFVFSSVHEVPRFAQGAFTECLHHLYSRLNNGRTLTQTSFGKPNEVTFRFAEKTLVDLVSDTPEGKVEGSGEHPFSTIYMVGDNPTADIRGGNRARGAWHPLLVRSGVYQEGDELLDTDRPRQILDGVGDVLPYILEREGLQ